MLNRRLIRVKVLQAVYAYHQSEIKNLSAAQSFLKKSVTGIEDTFNNVIQFADELFHFVYLNQNPADKHLKSSDYENFIFQLLSSNACIEQLKSHPKTKDIFKISSYNWTSDNDFLFLIYKQLLESDFVKEAKNQTDFGIENSKSFLLELYQFLIERSEDFNIKMEEINIHWNDEKIPVLKSVERLIKSCSEDIETIDPPIISRDLADDLDYAKKLLELTTKNHEKYEELISKLTPDWDSERIARIDLFIMVMAIAEFLDFSNIPVKVTLNEYLELAKIYSTPQSSKFINGILDKLLNELKQANKVKKTGRGLVE